MLQPLHVHFEFYLTILNITCIILDSGIKLICGHIVTLYIDCLTLATCTVQLSQAMDKLYNSIFSFPTSVQSNKSTIIKSVHEFSLKMHFNCVTV